MSKRAFTLVELLVVISIVSLLASIVMGALGSSRARAQTTKRVRDVQEVQKALELYAAANGGAYPAVSGTVGNSLCLDCANTDYNSGTAKSNLQTLLSPYLKILPTDPAKPAGGFTDGRGYWYKSDGKDYKFVSVINSTQTLLNSIAETLRDYSFGQSSQIGIRKTSSARANNWTPSCDPANCVSSVSLVGNSTWSSQVGYRITDQPSTDHNSPPMTGGLIYGTRIVQVPSGSSLELFDPWNFPIPTPGSWTGPYSGYYYLKFDWPPPSSITLD